MSQISSVYDAMNSRIASVLTSHLRLNNPYAIEKNPTLLLKLGYGVVIGPGTNNPKQLSNQLAINREMRVIISRKFYALPNKPADRATAEKLLLEDQFLVIKDFERNTTLNETAAVTNYETDGGLQFVNESNEDFLYIDTTFSVIYFENLLT